MCDIVNTLMLICMVLLEVRNLRTLPSTLVTKKLKARFTDIRKLYSWAVIQKVILPPIEARLRNGWIR